MSTVVDLIPTMKLWFRDRADSFPDEQFVLALNLAKTHVWRIILATDVSENWFSERSQWGDNTALNFFPVLEEGVDEYDLPPNFHQLKEAVFLTAGEGDMRLVKGNIGTDYWKLQREQMLQSVFLSEIPYDIIGSGVGRMRLPAPPTKTHEVKLDYIKQPVEWTTETDVIDDFPMVCRDLIAEDAAAVLRFGVSDNRYEKFSLAWGERVKQLPRTMRRDETGPEMVEGMFEGWG